MPCTPRFEHLLDQPGIDVGYAHSGAMPAGVAGAHQMRRHAEVDRAVLEIDDEEIEARARPSPRPASGSR
jgi:hypothetical protein